MEASLSPPKKAAIVYPESDGKPMADNTKQFLWIQMLQGGLAALFRDDPDVFVAGDLFWYPVEGFPEIVNAPDVMVAFGRPKGHRRSYKQWEERDVAPQVVFEILSPSNGYLEMENKLDWYEDHGVEEYYVYDPDSNALRVYLRDGSVLLRHRKVDGFVSPRTKVRFDFSGPEMTVYHPDGRPFQPYEQVARARAEAERRAGRLAELSRKLLAGQISDEEKQELARLAAPTP